MRWFSGLSWRILHTIWHTPDVQYVPRSVQYRAALICRHQLLPFKYHGTKSRFYFTSKNYISAPVTSQNINRIVVNLKSLHRGTYFESWPRQPPSWLCSPLYPAVFLGRMPESHIQGRHCILTWFPNPSTLNSWSFSHFRSGNSGMNKIECCRISCENAFPKILHNSTQVFPLE
jgi:hypothetical protein